MTGALPVRVPGAAEMAAIDAHLAFVVITIPGIVDEVTDKPRTITALAELQNWCRRLARGRASRGEPPLSLPQRYALVLGVYGALEPHTSPQGIVWRAMLRAAGRFAEGQDEPVETTYLLVTVRGAAHLERAPQQTDEEKEEEDGSQEDSPLDPPTPEAWMLKHAKAHLAETGKKLPRDAGVAACKAALGCTIRAARAAYKALPTELKFNPGERHS